jgi:hypothetical protein
LSYQGDGNLVAYQQASPYWSSDSAGTTANRAAMQTDGNFVVYDVANVPRWNSGTHGHPGAFLRMLASCAATVYDTDGTTVLWQSGVPAE